MKVAALVTVGALAVVTGVAVGLALGMFMELKRHER